MNIIAMREEDYFDLKFLFRFETLVLVACLQPVFCKYNHQNNQDKFIMSNQCNT